MIASDRTQHVLVALGYTPGTRSQVTMFDGSIAHRTRGALPRGLAAQCLQAAASCRSLSHPKGCHLAAVAAWACGHRRRFAAAMPISPPRRSDHQASQCRKRIRKCDQDYKYLAADLSLVLTRGSVQGCEAAARARSQSAACLRSAAPTPFCRFACARTRENRPTSGDTSTHGGAT